MQKKDNFTFLPLNEVKDRRLRTKGVTHSITKRLNQFAMLLRQINILIILKFALQIR